MADTPGKKSEKDPEVIEKAARRRFTAEYKQRIAREAEQCSQPGEIGALLRREGLYSSMLARWRRQLHQETMTSPSQRRPVNAARNDRPTKSLKSSNATMNGSRKNSARRS
ncbi:Transposase [Stieleria bergensis]|uniref:Transposase n=1 Tax=Stieleria bergensis TaxID=2528025 RepID=A0A517SVJ0_9BACT|nr:Transposase [Planctomycetes bacterium SV_7m_r]